MLVPIDEVVTFDTVTHSVSTGGITDADSAPTFDVYEETTDAGMLGAQTMTKRTSLTGNYRGTFTASAANGFEAGKWYSVIATGIVGGVTGKTVAMQFRCTPAETVAGVLKTDAAAINGVSTSSVTTVNANVGTTQPMNFTGTGAAALAKVDVQEFGGTAGTFAAGRPEVNTTHAAGTAWNSGAIGAATLAADTITAAKIAADAIGASELAADAVAEIQSGLATSASVAAIQADTDDIQTRLPAALVSGRIDASVGAVAANAITAAGIADGAIDRATFAADTGLQTVRSGTAQAGGVNSITLDAGASATDNAYTGMRLSVTGGAGVGGNGLIIGYVGVTKVATVAPTWTLGAPNNTSTFAIVPAGADVETWRTEQPYGLTNSEVPAFVGEINTDAINANALAASAVAEIQSGLSTLTAAGLLDLADGVETGVTLRQAQRVQLAAAAGKTDGFVSGGAGTGHVRNTGDTKNRITATYDANGNRTVIVLDLT